MTLRGSDGWLPQAHHFRSACRVHRGRLRGRLGAGFPGGQGVLRPLRGQHLAGRSTQDTPAGSRTS